MRVEIRQASQADCGQLAEMVKALSDEQEALGETPIPEQIERAITYAFESGQPIWVADDGEALIGFCAWVALPELPVGDVMGFGTFVCPEYRRHGLSQHLRDTAIAYWQSRGAKSVSGVVVEGNEAGMRSALSAGFRVVGQVVRKDFHEGQEGLRQGQGRQGDGAEKLLN